MIESSSPEQSSPDEHGTVVGLLQFHRQLMTAVRRRKATDTKAREVDYSSQKRNERKTLMHVDKHTRASAKYLSAILSVGKGWRRPEWPN